MDTTTQSQTITSDLVEGVEPPSTASAGWGDYPLDAVFVRTEARSVSEVVKRIVGNRYVLDPDFQRDFVWSLQKQSKLIESCVMRIPLPVFYVAEGPDGRIMVVDGLQRLSTFTRFLGNKFKLSGLSSGETGGGSHSLEGKLFSELPLNLQERVQDTQLTMYILDAKAPERARLDIFDRVNSGEPLSRQQMRNALHNGPATVWLKEAANGEPFQNATGGTLNAKTMRDREAINRYCAFRLLGRKKYISSDMDGFLADGLRKLQEMNAKQRAVLRFEFDEAMLLNIELFAQHAFRKSLVDPEGARSVINISLFEICAVTMSGLVIPSGVVARRKIRKAVVALLDDVEFVKAITYSTNSTIAVQTRFEMMEVAMRSVFET
jgi:hypothetical protein